MGRLSEFLYLGMPCGPWSVGRLQVFYEMLPEISNKAEYLETTHFCFKQWWMQFFQKNFWMGDTFTWFKRLVRASHLLSVITPLLAPSSSLPCHWFSSFWLSWSPLLHGLSSWLRRACSPVAVGGSARGSGFSEERELQGARAEQPGVSGSRARLNSVYRPVALWCVGFRRGSNLYPLHLQADSIPCTTRKGTPNSQYSFLMSFYSFFLFSKEVCGLAAYWLVGEESLPYFRCQQL